MRDYPWYEVVNKDAPLEQGDFIQECPIVIPPQELRYDTAIEVDAELYNVIVMSQSCDLVAGKVELVLVCPYWTLDEFEEQDASYKSAKMKENLRRGNIHGYHLLKECPENDFKLGLIVVDFRNIYSIPFNFLKDFAASNEKRLRLLPPYREHLSQAFARFFMRVGLPIDIPSFLT
jgi:hypothetical protein